MKKSSINRNVPIQNSPIKKILQGPPYSRTSPRKSQSELRLNHIAGDRHSYRLNSFSYWTWAMLRWYSTHIQNYLLKFKSFWGEFCPYLQWQGLHNVNGAERPTKQYGVQRWLGRILQVFFKTSVMTILTMVIVMNIRRVSALSYQANYNSQHPSPDNIG